MYYNLIFSKKYEKYADFFLITVVSLQTLADAMKMQAEATIKISDVIEDEQK